MPDVDDEDSPLLLVMQRADQACAAKEIADAQQDAVRCPESHKRRGKSPIAREPGDQVHRAKAQSGGWTKCKVPCEPGTKLVLGWRLNESSRLVAIVVMRYSPRA